MQTILVPTDFSVNAENAYHYAIHLAETFSSKILFVHVGQPVIKNPQERDLIIEKYMKVSTDKLIETVDKIYASVGLKRNTDTTKFLIKVNPFVVETLIEIVSHYTVDLIVMGTQGATGLKKVFFGSNTANLVKQVKCSVMVIPQQTSYKHKIKHIAIASTLHYIEEELQKIIPYAQLFDAAIDIIHVYPIYPDGIDLEKLDNHALLDRLKNIYPHLYLHFINTINDNESEVGIAEFLRVYKPDMLAMHPRFKDFWEGLLDGSVSNSFVSNTKIPVLIMKS